MQRLLFAEAILLKREAFVLVCIPCRPLATRQPETAGAGSLLFAAWICSLLEERCPGPPPHHLLGLRQLLLARLSDLPSVSCFALQTDSSADKQTSYPCCLQEAPLSGHALQAPLQIIG